MGFRAIVCFFFFPELFTFLWFIILILLWKIS